MISENMSPDVRLILNDQPITVRRAMAEEIIDLRHRVLRAGLPRSEAIFPGDELPGNHHFGAFGDAESSAALCCATFHLSSWKDQPAWQLRGMATDPAWVGIGLGRAVLNLAIGSIKAASPVHQFWCNARLIAIPFYQKMGWEIASERFEIPTAGPHHRMVLTPSP
jgi:GNAT superfamily N-acetyltransferase